MNLLEALVLFSKNKASLLLDKSVNAPRAGVERHHLFPKGYLAKLGITRRDINQIGNYALVEWSDNTEISDKPPAEHFHKYAKRFSAEELERMRYWHALFEGWENMDYGEFLAARRRGLARVIRDAYGRLLD